jgi:hypothetical protein
MKNKEETIDITEAAPYITKRLADCLEILNAIEDKEMPLSKVIKEIKEMLDMFEV